VLPLGKFTTEFFLRVDGGVHLASEFTLCLAHGGNYIHERHVSDHHEIYVAAGGLGSGRHGTENKGGLNMAPHFGKGVRQNLGETEGLSNETAEFIEDLAMPVSLEVRLPAFDRASENAGAGQLLKLSLDGAGAKAHGLDNLPLIKSLIRMSEKPSKNGLFRCPEEGVPERDLDCGLSTHNGYDSTQIGVDSQTRCQC
jgi:hypothetical protein